MKETKVEIKLLDFQIKGDDRGSLISLEQYDNIPFEIKRVYYIFDTKSDIRRGLHAHRNLQQVLIAINGSCTVLLDNGVEKVEVELNSRSKGLFIDKLVWREIYNFSKNAVLVVLANEHYDEKDYIRDYHDFLEVVQ